MPKIIKNKQYYKFCLYGFLKNLKFFEPFLMLFFLDKGVTFLQIGTLYAIREISINIIEIPSGVFADMLGRRKAMIVSFMAYITSFVVFYYSLNYVWLLGAMLFFSLGDALRTGTHKAMIFDYLQINNLMTEKINYYGHTRSWSQIGSAVSSILAALIVIFTGNYKVVFIFSTLPYIFNIVLVWSYPKVLDGKITESNLSVKHRFELLAKDMYSSFKNREFWVVLMNLSTYQGYFKTVKDYLQPIIVLSVGSVIVFSDVTHKQQVAIVVGVVYFVIYIISSLTSRYSNSVVLLFKSSHTVINFTLVLGLLTGVISGVMVLKNNYVVSIIIFIIIFIIQNLRKPIGTSIIADKVENRVLATGLSVQSQVDSLLTSLFAIVLGFLIDTYGLGYALLYLGSGLLGFVILFWLKPEKPKANNL